LSIHQSGDYRSTKNSQKIGSDPLNFTIFQFSITFGSEEFNLIHLFMRHLIFFSSLIFDPKIPFSSCANNGRLLVFKKILFFALARLLLGVDGILLCKRWGVGVTD
jgi:hypothetical protein